MVTSEAQVENRRDNPAALSVLGLGAMSSALARTLIAKGHATTVWNRSLGKINAFVELGAQGADTAEAAVAASPVVVTCAVDDAAFGEVVGLIQRELEGRTLIEAAMTERSRTWTLLRPSWFQQVVTDDHSFLGAIRHHGEMAMPSGGRSYRLGGCPRHRCRSRDGRPHPASHCGRAYTVTAPKALSVATVAANIAAATKRHVRAEDPVSRRRHRNLDPWLAAVVSGVYRRVQADMFSVVSEDVETVTGRPARSIEDFVNEHAQCWLTLLRGAPAPIPTSRRALRGGRR
jgi:NAD binding domain of 6-phosphogluconate dehydrogenase